jgi:hypothetical protein
MRTIGWTDHVGSCEACSVRAFATAAANAQNAIHETACREQEEHAGCDGA